MTLMYSLVKQNRCDGQMFVDGYAKINEILNILNYGTINYDILRINVLLCTMTLRGIEKRNWFNSIEGVYKRKDIPEGYAAYPAISIGGAGKQSGAFTGEECSLACVNEPTCVAFNYSYKDDGTGTIVGRCWFHELATKCGALRTAENRLKSETRS
ncbi:hypothetical protein CAPTEDRAFT_210067 [Capitella teleta]|uniref:Uncharacterized protein n=1 Tax=Capitella teleta TaxID=283909 RepID=R7VD11_CAPTE|nr:hypothetical protein CAPTEDRAFT_210067 [Capitella teleta]|eukprot:ELU14166.1 hypothetical protein CAPTEDRAFT_210067 [Capitella teleta]